MKIVMEASSDGSRQGASEGALMSFARMTVSRCDTTPRSTMPKTQSLVHSAVIIREALLSLEFVGTSIAHWLSRPLTCSEQGR